MSHLYASSRSKNPGPLDTASVKNEENTSPKAVSVVVDNTTKVNIIAFDVFKKYFLVDGEDKRALSYVHSFLAFKRLGVFKY